MVTTHSAPPVVYSEGGAQCPCHADFQTAPPGPSTCWGHTWHLAVPTEGLTPDAERCSSHPSQVAVSGNQAEGFEMEGVLLLPCPFSRKCLLAPWVGPACWSWPHSVTSDSETGWAWYLGATKAGTRTTVST